MHICVRVGAHECRYPRRPEEGCGSLGARVRGSCEQLGVGAGT